MKILFLGAHFPRPNNPTIGVWALAQVTALQGAGHEVKVVSPIPAIPAFIARLMRLGSSAECPARYLWGSVETQYVRWPLYPVGPIARYLRARPDIWVKLAWMLSSRKFLKIAQDFCPAVIFAHHGQLSGFIAAAISQRTDIPFLITEHAFGDIESCGINPHRKRHYERIIRDVSSWIAVSNRMRDTMRKLFPTAPSLTVHNGGDRVPSGFGLTPRPPELIGCVIVLSVCFFYKRKNVPLLIDSFDQIAARHPKARLIVVGSGDDQEAISAAAARARNGAQIMLVGPLSHDAALQYTAWSDLVVNIAVDEPFSTVFSDAMMAGKPIIFSADCGITDVVQNGVQGLSVLPGDRDSAAAAIDTLLGDDARRLQCARAAADLAHSKLSWEMNAARMTELFESALKKSR